MYDDQVMKHVTKSASRLQGEKKTQTFDRIDPSISITGVLHKFKIESGNDGIHKESAM